MTLFRQPSIALGVCEILLVLNGDENNDNDSGGTKCTLVMKKRRTVSSIYALMLLPLGFVDEITQPD